MTLPDELVTAATDAVVAEWALFRSPKSGGTELVRSEYEEVTRTAVAAVLRALPESEIVRAVAARAAIHNVRDGLYVLAAIAKLADE